jgi:type IV secretory pathway TrbL component
MLIEKYLAVLDPLGAEASEREEARWNPERETIILAAAGAAKVLGEQHSVTKAFAKAAQTMGRVAIWHARQAMKTLREDQREAIAAVAED